MKKLILTITLACMSVMATQAQTKGEWYIGTGDVSDVAWTELSVSPTVGYGITENLILGVALNQVSGETLNVDVNARYLVRGYFAYLESNLSLNTDDVRLGVGKMFTLLSNVYVDPKIVYSTGDQTTNLEIGFGFRF